MFSLSKIVFAVAAFLAVAAYASPVAQEGKEAGVNGVIEPIETKIPKVKVYFGKDPGPLPVPKLAPAPTPSPRFTAPVKIVKDIK
jgi:hypothetical protein